MSKLYRTVGVGAKQRTKEVTNEKIRVFANETAIDAVLSNLDEDEIVATEGGAESSTRIGNPLGTILAIHSNAVPYGYLPCNGVAFDEHQYPALYALLGDNHTPYSYDKSRLGEWEKVTISTDSNNPTVMPYDGFLTVRNFVGTSACNVYVNGEIITNEGASQNAPRGKTLPFRKGDLIYTNVATDSTSYFLACYYTHFNVIKATSGLEETQQDYVLQSLFTTLPIVQQVTFYTPTPSAVGFSSPIDFRAKLSTAGYDIDDFDEVTFCIGTNQYNNLGFSDITILRVEGNRGIGVSGVINTTYFDWSTGVLDAGLAVHSATFRKYGSNTKIIEF